MNQTTVMSANSLKSIERLFENILTSFNSEDWSLKKIESIYKQIRNIYYAQECILDDEDSNYVSMEGSKNLMNRPIMSASRVQPTNGKGILTTVNHTREIFILIENLQSFYHQPENFASSVTRECFTQKYESEIKSQLTTIKELLQGS